MIMLRDGLGKVMLFDGKQQAIWLTAYRLRVLLNNRRKARMKRISTPTLSNIALAISIFALIVSLINTAIKLGFL